MPWLKIINGETLGRVFPLDRDLTVLGRDDNCDVVLDDHQVSKRHAQIICSGDSYLIEDLGSTNGTRVNEQALIGSRPLVDGDEIEVGETRFAFLDSTTIKGSLDVSPATAGQTERVHPEAKLQALLKIAGALGGTIDLDGVLRKILEALFTILPQAERGFILLRGEGTGELTLKASRDRLQGSGQPMFSRTIFNLVTREGRAVLCEDVGTDPRFGSSPSIKESRIRTMICVPLWNHERQPIGVLQIDTKDEQDRFDEDDLELLVAVAGPVSVAVENARLQGIAVKQAEMEREAWDARAVQFAMIPEKKPDLPGYEFWHFYQPARSVGGDYFDYRPIPRSGRTADQPTNRWAVAIGDVSGKGMPAALLMARLSSEVRLLLQSEPDPSRVVERLNSDLCAARIDERFITFLLIVLDGERHELTVVNAGHMDPMIRRSDGRIEMIGEDQSGPPLGISEGRAYESSRTPISPGDIAVLYTDGVNEALNDEGRLFGVGRLKQGLASAPSESVKVGESILDAVRRHVAGRTQSDDITLLCFSRGTNLS